MVCAKMFKKGRGLKIHQTKSGCAAQISNRMKSKSKAASTQDTNHSDARGDVNQETTLKGIGSQSMEAMEKFSNEKK